MRQLVILFYILISPIILCSGPLKAHAEVTVEASLSHLSFPQDRAAKLVITVTGASRTSAIELPEIVDIILHSRGQSSQINMINGSVSSSISHNYLVQAMQQGEFTIPPIKVTAGGETFTTEAISFEVTGTSQENSGRPGSTSRTAENAVFIRITETKSHYPGEIVPIKIKAYFSQEYKADSISLPTIQGDGVVMPELKDKPLQTQESLGGRMYNVLIWNTSLSGIKVGKHPITFGLEASLLIPQKRRSISPFGGSSPFDDSFLDNFFGNYRRKPISVTSPEILFNVLTLPTDNRPDNFTGAIGDFQLKVAAAPLTLEVGEPLTLNMEISGTGNFDRVEAPVFPESPDWKTYSPTSFFSKEGNNYSGTKGFEQAVVARSNAISDIPSLSFSYFDPRKKSYVTRTSSPIGIRLNESAAATIAQPIPPTSSLQQPGVQASPTPDMLGLAPIHLESGIFYQHIVPPTKKSWFLTVCGVCALLLLSLFFLRMHQLNIERHPEIRQQNHKKQLLENNLKKIEDAQISGDSRTFLAISRTAIQTQLGLLWHMEPTAISLADIKNRLKTDLQLIEIFSAAEEAAYGGATLSKEKMQDYFIQLKAELEELL